MHVVQMAFLKRFFGSCFGTSVGMQARDRCCDCRKVVVLSLETSVTAWAPPAREKADEELVMTVGLYC